jgi:hypothetical protein
MGWTWLKQKLGLQPSEADAPSVTEVPQPAVFSHKLDEICAIYGASYLRTVISPNEVQIMLVREDATLSAVGSTTAEAVDAVITKAVKCWGDL